MATERVYYTDPYLTEADAAVRSCTRTERGWELLLDQISLRSVACAQNAALMLDDALRAGL